MDLDIIRSTLTGLVAEDLLSPDLRIAWHSGEPLVLPISYYEEAFKLIAEILGSRKFRFVFQTNGTLITQSWASLFRRWEVIVGLSCDGPKRFHDTYRKTRSGRGTFSDVIRAKDVLQTAGIPLRVICVLSEESLNYTQEFFEFFEWFGLDDLALNIQEQDGSHTVKNSAAQPSIERYKDFLLIYAELVARHNSKQQVRELQKGTSFIFSEVPTAMFQEHEPCRILTIGVDGSVGTLSPELHGERHPDWGELTYTSVSRADWINDLRASEKLFGVVRSVDKGRRLCEDSCSYFAVCGGGSPSNKLGEHGTFEATETQACRFYVKAVADAATEFLIKELRRVEFTSTVQPGSGQWPV